MELINEMKYFEGKEPIPNCGQKQARPAWLIYCAIAILAWGAWGVVSKVEVRFVDPYIGQVLLTVGWMPLVFLSLFSKKLRQDQTRLKGSAYACLTGLLSAGGNVAFFAALKQGGPASIVVPVSGLYPLITVPAALVILKEKLNWIQTMGIGLALAAILLLGEG
jgi:uncharacterized membrane protein